MRRLDTREADFDRRLIELTSWQENLDQEIDRTVAGILAAIASRGDAALLEFTAQFDRLAVDSVAELEVPEDRMTVAIGDEALRKSL